MGRKNSNVKHGYTHARNKDAMLKYNSFIDLSVPSDSGCVKASYPDELSAKIEAAASLSRPYLCQRCGNWHLK
jgi:hypothetical protein